MPLPQYEAKKYGDHTYALAPNRDGARPAVAVGVSVGNPRLWSRSDLDLWLVDSLTLGCIVTGMETASDTSKQAEDLALEAERRAMEAPTQDERDFWLRMADFWWGKA